jgi:hypothetical protein
VNTAQKIRDFARLSLGSDVVDLRDVSVRTVFLNVVLGLLMMVAITVHLGLLALQLIVSILLAVYDLLAKGLKVLLHIRPREEDEHRLSVNASTGIPGYCTCGASGYLCVGCQRVYCSLLAPIANGLCPGCSAKHG